MLVSGFVDLSAAAVLPPPEPKKEEAATPAPVTAPAPPAQAERQRIFTLEDEGVSPAVPIRQDVPRVPTQIANQARDHGFLELTIDEQGRVVNATIRMSLHPVYDSQLLAVARDWRYQPATFNGKPVKFRKTIQITITK